MTVFYWGFVGTVISGYRVRNGQWTEIGKGDPQRPQVGKLGVCLKVIRHKVALKTMAEILA